MSIALSTASAAEPQTQPATQPARTRILHFPKSSRVIGSLFAYSRDNPPRDVINPPVDGELLGRVSGDIVVPEGKLLFLHIWEHGGRNPSCLSRLAPDDLYAVRFDKPWTSKIKPGDAIIPHITRLTGLRCLGIGTTHVTNKGLRQLARLKHLERLVLPTTTTNEGLPEVLRLPSLKALGLRSNQITDQGLATLTGIPTLEELDLYSDEITDAGLVHLTKLPRLHFLQLYGVKITDAGMTLVARISSLKALNVSRLNITDAGLAELAKLRELESLDLGDTQVTDEGLVHLRSFGSLKTLTFTNGREGHYSQLTERGLAHLGEVKSLEHLAVTTPVNGEGLAHIAGLPHLAQLDTGDYCSDADLERIGEMQSLRSLYVGGKEITDAGLAHLAKLGNLQTLTVKTPLTDQSLAHLGRLTSLTWLDIRIMAWTNSHLTFSGLRRLNTLSNLRLLKVYGEVRQDGSGLDLSGLTALEILTIENIARETRFTDQDLITISKLKTLRELRLSGDFTDEGMAHLAHLPELTIFTTGWREARITDRGLAELSKCRKLWSLHISGDFTDKGLACLEDMPELTLVSIESKRPFSDQAVARFKAKRPDARLTQRSQPPGGRTAEKSSGKAPAK